MSPLEKKKLEVELLRVNAAKEEMNLKILEAQDQISKLTEYVKIQEEKEIEIKKRLQ